MQIRTNPAVRVLVLLTIILGLGGFAAATVAAQSIPCVDEPFLGNFDDDDDGVLTAAEVRSTAPDNEEIQQVADQMEAAGLAGIRYSDCGDSDESDQGGDNAQSGESATNVADEDAGTGDDGAQEAEDDDADATPAATAEADAEVDQPNDSDWFDERLKVTTLPAVGSGAAPSRVDDTADQVAITALGAALVATGAAWRRRRAA